MAASKQQKDEFREALCDLVDINFEELHDSYCHLVVTGNVFDVDNVTFEHQS